MRCSPPTDSANENHILHFYRFTSPLSLTYYYYYDYYDGLNSAPSQYKYLLNRYVNTSDMHTHSYRSMTIQTLGVCYPKINKTDEILKYSYIREFKATRTQKSPNFYCAIKEIIRMKTVSIFCLLASIGTQILFAAIEVTSHHRCQREIDHPKRVRICCQASRIRSLYRLSPDREVTSNSIPQLLCGYSPTTEID